MIDKTKRAVISGVTFGLAAIFVTWALVSEESPFYQDLLRPGILRSTWQVLNIPAFMVLMISRSVALAVLILFVQWSVIGGCCSLLLTKHLGRRN